MASNPSQVDPQTKPSTKSTLDVEQAICTEPDSSADLNVEVRDHSKRAQWLRAAVLGANDGLLSTAALMIGVGSVRKDVKTMILTGIAGLLAGAFSMAMGEFVSVYSQYDIELSDLKRENEATNGTQDDLEESKKHLPSPFQASAASAVSFAVGAAVPLLAAAFIRDYDVRLAVVIVAVSLALLGFGWLAAALGQAAPLKSALRVLGGGWIAMGVTYGLTKLIGSTGLGQ
ncbi:hypothetical protein Ancab_017344 [Ancistrocladus abbreviatus]